MLFSTSIAISKEIYVSQWPCSISTSSLSEHTNFLNFIRWTNGLVRVVIARVSAGLENDSIRGGAPRRSGVVDATRRGGVSLVGNMPGRA